MILYRPVGEKEYILIEQSGFTRFPPRLPNQPIFYPVLNIEYARKIASEWNVEDVNSGYMGYVLQFEIKEEFIDHYEVHTVGASWHQEYWIPAEDLSKLNESIIGKISVLKKYKKNQ